MKYISLFSGIEAASVAHDGCFVSCMRMTRGS